MKIEEITLYRVAMPLVYPFRTSYGNDDCIEAILVRMRSGNLTGWGEAAPLSSPGYSAECARTAYIMVRDFLAPRLLGVDIQSGEQLQERLSVYKGNPFAKASLDLAWWDLHARSLNRPLYQVLGGERTTVEVGADFGIMESIDGLLATIQQAVDSGFKRVKLKFRPGWDVPMVAAVRKRFPDLRMHIDCNSAYRIEDVAMFKELDAYGLEMIEQPLQHDDLLDHAALQKELETPICLDESITSPSKVEKALRINACRWVNIKPGRMGGLTPALEANKICVEAGIPCWIGGMLESAVGAHHCLALATLPNIRYPSDIFPSSRFYKEDLSEPEVRLSGPSEVTVSQEPGCGATPNLKRLKQQCQESEILVE